MKVYNNVFHDLNNKVGIVRVYSSDGITFNDNIYYTEKEKPMDYISDYFSFDEWKAATGDNSTFSDYQFPDSTRSIES